MTTNSSSSSSSSSSFFEKYWKEFHNQDDAFEEYKKIRDIAKNVGIFAFQKPPFEFNKFQKKKKEQQTTIPSDDQDKVAVVDDDDDVSSTLSIDPKTSSSLSSKKPQRKQMGGMMYVVGDRKMVGLVCLGLRPRPCGGGCFPLHMFGYESFFLHDEPMIAYADCEYEVGLNPLCVKEEMLKTLLTYIRQAIFELLIHQGKVDETLARMKAERVPFDIETCHRPEKVSFHIKIQAIILRDMKAQRTFWFKVQSLINADQARDDPKALMLRVNAQSGKEIIQISFLDPKVYDKQQGQLFRLLGASKNDGSDRINCLVPEGKHVYDITLEMWMRSLVMRRGATKGVSLPKSWYELVSSSPSPSSSSFSLNNTKKVPHQNNMRISKHVTNEMPKRMPEPTCLDDGTTNAFLGKTSQLCEFIDSNWKVTPSNMRLQRRGECWWVTFHASCCYCPLKGAEHNSAATMLVLFKRYNGSWGYAIKCQAANHSEVVRVAEKGDVPSQFVPPI